MRGLYMKFMRYWNPTKGSSVPVEHRNILRELTKSILQQSLYRLELPIYSTLARFTDTSANRNFPDAVGFNDRNTTTLSAFFVCGRVSSKYRAQWNGVKLVQFIEL